MCAPVCNPCNICKPCAANPCNDDYGIAFTIKNGFFYPQDCVLREIFDRCNGKGGYWVEGAMRYNFWRDLNVELSGSYFSKKGIALCGNEYTKVKLPTFGLGLKYFFMCKDYYNCDSCWNRLSFFVGGGLRVFFYKERNGSPYVAQCVDKTTVGGMVNAGLEIDLYKGLFLDLFVDYNFGKVDLDRNDLCNTCNPCCNPTPTSSTQCTSCCPSCCFDLKVGGVVGGIGLGYKF